MTTTFAKERKAQDFSTLLALIDTADQHKAQLLSSYWAVADQMLADIGSIKGELPSPAQNKIIRSIMDAIQEKFGTEVYSYETIVAMVKLADATPKERRRGDPAFWAFIGLIAKSVGKALVNQKPVSKPTTNSPGVLQRNKDIAMLDIQGTQIRHMMQTANVMDDENKKMVAEAAEVTASSSRRLALFLSQNGDEPDHLRILHEALDLVQSGALKKSSKTQKLVTDLTEACQSWTR